MALPFLNPRKIASAVIAKQMKSGEVVNSSAEPEDHPLVPVAEAMLAAIAAKDAVALAKALADSSKPKED